ncbi:LysR family transcriptional regulator [Legionella israelensis]|uniref:LysR family transcriptional regulator n=1 Tax=Legionella israelensis TaxID=454 RepID=A0AAX1ECS8_9GAMM|nr:LysR family transcriptional regulator [Legionella israelensis]QBR82915.1 LysR family transcriptional regulator [Legionella israelensis]
MINIKYMKTFLTIVDEGSFISAAQKLHKTQPTITATIKQLESLLGFELFDRSSYHIKLTGSGERFYSEVKLFFKEYAEFESKIDLIKQGIESNIHIDWDIALDFKPYIFAINQLAVLYPQTRIYLENHHFSECKKRLLSKKTDLCLAVYDESHPNIYCVPLIDINMMAVSNPQYFSANKDKLLMQIMIGGTQQPLAELGISPLSAKHPRCLVKDMHTAKELIISGLGVGRLPEHFVKEELTSGELIALPEDQFAKARMTIYCMRLKDKKPEAFAEKLWNSLIEIS